MKKELYVRLRDLKQWVQPHNHTKEETGEMIIMEQFLCLVSSDLQIWIKECNPGFAAEASSKVFAADRRKAQPWTYAHWRGERELSRPPQQPLPPKNTSGEGKSAADRNSPSEPSPAFKTNGLKIPVRYECRQKGHKKTKCPNNPDKQSNICTVPRG